MIYHKPAESCPVCGGMMVERCEMCGYKQTSIGDFYSEMLVNVDPSMLKEPYPRTDKQRAFIMRLFRKRYPDATVKWKKFKV